MGAALDRMPLDGDSKQVLISALNGRYKEFLILYAKHFCAKTGVTIAQVLELDGSKLLLRLWDAANQIEERSINFQNVAGVVVTASTVGDVRQILVDMARIASEALGDELAPHIAFLGSQESEKVLGAYLLNDLIDMSTLECLNQDDAHPVINALNKPSADGDQTAEVALQSDPDVDHQLLIKLGFKQPVKLKAVTIRARTEDETAPKVVKIFQGQAAIGFQEADDQEAVQTLDLMGHEIDTGDPIPLRFVKFQNVSTLQMFIQSNFGADVTRIEQLEFWGTLTETVDMKAWKPVTNSLSNPIAGIIEPAEKDDASGV